jgi:hypothetical protein
VRARSTFLAKSKTLLTALVQGHFSVPITWRFSWQLNYWHTLGTAVSVFLQQKAIVAFLNNLDLNWSLRHFLKRKAGSLWVLCGRKRRANPLPYVGE